MDHRKLTRQLIARVRELQEELDDAYETLGDREAQHEMRHRELYAELRTVECERERERRDNSNRRFDRDHVLRDLETACQRGDDWGRRRAMNRLRDL